MNEISSTAKIFPGVKLGKNARVGDYVVIGEPARGAGKPVETIIGDNAVIRSHTVIYAGNRIGKNFQTGHGVLVRESNDIGADVSVGSGSTVEHHVRIEDRVRLHSNVFVPEFSTLRRGCWIGPGVVLTNALYPLSPNAKNELRGPVIEANAKIGANASVLPGVSIGKNALIGAGSVVVKDVRTNQVAVGNPAREVNDIKNISAYKTSPSATSLIPLADLRAQYHSISTDIDAAIRTVLESGSYIQGSQVVSFEQRFAGYIGTSHAVGVSSGTAAVHLALEALGVGVGVGDEVITSPFTFIATAEAIEHAGARPVFADIDPATLCISPAAIEKAITKKTKAIVVVHLHGQPAAMDEILSVAKKHKLFVIEDAAQAHGARYKGRLIGSIGDAGCFSFFPAKNLGAVGDAGAVTTSNKKLAEKVALLRDHGRSEKYLHAVPGYNHRLDALQAAVLSVKLAHLDGWNDRRRAIAARYRSELEKRLEMSAEPSGTRAVYHQFVVRLKNRDRLKSFLKDNGIESGVHYPVPLHLQPALSHLKYRQGRFAASEKAAASVLSLPVYPELTDAQVDRVIRTVLKFLK